MTLFFLLGATSSVQFPVGTLRSTQAVPGAAFEPESESEREVSSDGIAATELFGKRSVRVLSGVRGEKNTTMALDESTENTTVCDEVLPRDNGVMELCRHVVVRDVFFTKNKKNKKKKLSPCWPTDEHSDQAHDACQKWREDPGAVCSRGAPNNNTQRQKNLKTKKKKKIKKQKKKKKTFFSL